MNVERLVLAQKQLGEVIPDKTNLTLYTDETSNLELNIQDTICLIKMGICMF